MRKDAGEGYCGGMFWECKVQVGLKGSVMETVVMMTRGMHGS